MSAELAARRTAAAAVLADYAEACAARRRRRPGAVGRPARRHARRCCSPRSAQPRRPGPAAQLEEIRLVLEAFDWETDDRQYALEQIDDIVNGEAL